MKLVPNNHCLVEGKVAFNLGIYYINMETGSLYP